MNKKGFTLIELLSVIVIMGIVTAIAIPLVSNIQDKNSKDNFEYFEGMIKEAVLLYENKYISLDENNSCVEIDYKKLLTTELIKEENFTCEGKIIGRRTNYYGFNYEYYLDCYDEKNHKIMDKENEGENITCNNGS